MAVTIKVNGVANSLVHKGSGGVSAATVPDVCKTPSPGGGCAAAVPERVPVGLARQGHCHREG